MNQESINITEEEIMDVLTDEMNRNQLYIAKTDIEKLKKAFILLFNRLSTEKCFNANIMISTTDQEISNKAGMLLAQMIEKRFPDAVLSLRESDFYNRKDKNTEYSGCKVLLVNYESVNSEKLYKTLSEIETEGWSPSIILCANTVSTDALKEYDIQDYRLYNYLCGFKIILNDLEINDIFDFVCDRLRQDGYELTESFTNKLYIYIQAVYPEARLTRQAFINDLIYRVYQIHFQKIINGVKLDETDVPFSIKAEELKNRISDRKEFCPENEDVIIEQLEIPVTGEKKPELEDDSISSTLTNIKAEKSHFSDLGNSKNVLILSMSTLPYVKPGTEVSASKYCFIEEENNNKSIQVFSGVSQLEPGTKLFISKLAQHGKKPDKIKIIILTTKETLKQVEPYKKSAVDVYAENIRRFICDGEPEDIKRLLPESEGVSYEDSIRNLYTNQNKVISNEECLSSELSELNNYLDVETVDLDNNPLQEIMKKLTLGEHVNLFIDLQGGSRTFMFTMFATVTMMRDKNVTIKDMFAIRYDKSNPIHQIEILNKEYAIIDLVSGIRAFSRYGRVEELQRFILSREKDNSTEESKLLEIMRNIESNMQINNPEGFTTELKKLAENDAELLKPDNYTDEQFKLIVEDLRNEYSPILKEHTVLDEIKWFREKAFTSSALTFVEDKIPTFLIGYDECAIIHINSHGLSGEAICKCCGGKNYYVPEKNIFDFGFKKVIQETEDKYYRRLCDKWVELFFTDKSGTISLKCCFPKEVLLEKEGMREALLILEETLKDRVWKPIKLNKLCSMVYGRDDSQSWNSLKKKINNLNTTRQSTVMDVGLTREVILGWFEKEAPIPNNRRADNGQENVNARVEAVYQFLITNEYKYRCENVCERKILEGLFSIALYSAIFNLNNKKYYCDVINGVLKSFLNQSEYLKKVLSDVSASYECDEQTKTNKLVFKGTNDKELSQEEFSYNIWKALMPDGIETEIKNKYIITDDKSRKYESKLDGLISDMEDPLKNTLDKWIEYADWYSDYRGYKNNLKNGGYDKVYRSNCSYKNMDLYLGSKTKEMEQYKELYNEHFYYIGDKYPNTIAGIFDKDNTEGYLGGVNWRIDLSKNGDDKDINKAKRQLLNTCILLYEALKTERNTTNHAANDSFNHMKYGHIQKAIQVFENLCKNLSEIYCTQNSGN